MGGKDAKTGSNQLWNFFKTHEIPPFEQRCRKRTLLSFGNCSSISIFFFTGLKSALEFFHATFIWLMSVLMWRIIFHMVACCWLSLPRQECLVAYGSYRTHRVWSGVTWTCPSCSAFRSPLLPTRGRSAVILMTSAMLQSWSSLPWS